MNRSTRTAPVSVGWAARSRRIGAVVPGGASDICGARPRKPLDFRRSRARCRAKTLTDARAMAKAKGAPRPERRDGRPLTATTGRSGQMVTLPAVGDARRRRETEQYGAPDKASQSCGGTASDPQVLRAAARCRGAGSRTVSSVPGELVVERGQRCISGGGNGQDAAVGHLATGFGTE